MLPPLTNQMGKAAVLLLSISLSLPSRAVCGISIQVFLRPLGAVDSGLTTCLAFLASSWGDSTLLFRLRLVHCYIPPYIHLLISFIFKQSWWTSDSDLILGQRGLRNLSTYRDILHCQPFGGSLLCEATPGPSTPIKSRFCLSMCPLHRPVNVHQTTPTPRGCRV